MAATASMGTAPEMSSSTKIGYPARGARKPATKRMEVIDPLFAHSPAEGVLLQLRALRRRRRVPG